MNFLPFSFLKPRPRLLKVKAFYIAHSATTDLLGSQNYFAADEKNAKTHSEGLKRVNSVLFEGEIVLWPPKIMQKAPMTSKIGLWDSIGRYETLGWFCIEKLNG